VFVTCRGYEAGIDPDVIDSGGMLGVLRPGLRRRDGCVCDRSLAKTRHDPACVRWLEWEDEDRRFISAAPRGAGMAREGVTATRC